MNIPRRQFIFLAGAALLRADDRPARDLITRSARPEDLETNPTAFSNYITPIENFFVRTHVYVPNVKLEDWRLKVEGEVATPLTFSLEMLKTLPQVELVSVLECAGNGRAFFQPTVPGIQWTNGAVGNARWRGVRLSDVLKRAGIKESAKEVLFDGADMPLGTMPDFQRSIPITKAMDSNTLLAFEMNGETLPVKHGFPLRVISPGWASDSWIKWLTGIRVLNKEHDGFWMKSAYRRPAKPVAPGSAVPPEQMQPVTSLKVKSLIVSPLNGTQVVAGTPVPIRGVAWSGDSGPITSVDVSVDGGRIWKAAALRADQKTRFGWRQWEFPWTPTENAYYTILARARDAAGNTQPIDQEWNPAGYGWNVIPRVQVDVVSQLTSAAPPAPTPASNPVPPQSLKSSCFTCHGEDVIRQQRLTRPQWDRELNKMTGWGAKVSADDREGLLDYLVRNFGPGSVDQ